jgi:saccharopine dehydrogenase-like NADP-dependent oxidoreductase
MVVVAVAGGTGGLGRTVLDAIADSGEHNAIVLSRTVSSPNAGVFVQAYSTHTIQAADATATNAFRRFALDYGNVDQIKHVLQENKVDVVVSCLVLVDEGSAQSQINLIRAAAQSGTVTRFIPTEYYIDFHAPIP